MLNEKAHVLVFINYWPAWPFESLHCNLQTEGNSVGLCQSVLQSHARRPVLLSHRVIGVWITTFPSNIHINFTNQNSLYTFWVYETGQDILSETMGLWKRTGYIVRNNGCTKPDRIYCQKQRMHVAYSLKTNVWFKPTNEENCQLTCSFSSASAKVLAVSCIRCQPVYSVRSRFAAGFAALGKSIQYVHNRKQEIS